MYENPPKGRPYSILTLSGGGVRGVISSLVLAEIEHRTNQPICKLFDLIAGSSSGGIISLLLSHPKQEGSTQPKYSAKDVADTLIERAEDIFNEPLFEEVLGIVDDLMAPKYGSKSKEKILTKYLGNTPMNQALTNVFITSYDTQLRIPVFFVSNPEMEKTGTNFRKVCTNISMVQTCMATSAAPTFFSPYKLGEYCLVDGGMFANNPTILAIIEAEQIPIAKQDNKLLCFVGTGSLTRRYEYNTVRNWGLLHWVKPLINIILDAQAEAVSSQLSQALPDSYSYYKFDTLLTLANDDLDDTSTSNIEALCEQATRLIKNQDKDLDTLCSQLTT